MAGIGEDIKDVLQELGTPFTIYKVDGTVIIGEYLDYEHYYSEAGEFRRQFGFSGDFQYDSQVEYGDLIKFNDKVFLVLNVRTTLFENASVDNSLYFLQCNNLGYFAKESKVRNAQYENEVSWLSVVENVHAVLSDEFIYINTNESQEQVLMNSSTDNYTLYCQGFPEIQQGFRWYPDKDNPDDYFKVVNVSRHRYPNCLVCRLEEESRE